MMKKPESTTSKHPFGAGAYPVQVPCYCFPDGSGASEKAHEKSESPAQERREDLAESRNEKEKEND